MSALDRVIKIAEHEKISITAKGSLVYRLLKHDALIDAAKTELAVLRTRIAELEAQHQEEVQVKLKLRDIIVNLEEAQQPTVCFKCNHWEAKYGFGGNSHFKNWICTGCNKLCKDCTCR